MITAKGFFDGNKSHINKSGDSFYEPHLKGQSPTLCVVFCSDSREDIHLIGDIAPSMGEIFAIENAGNIIAGSTAASGSVMYALEHLKTKDLLVIGHTGCGAVTAVFHDYEKEAREIADHIRSLDNVRRLAIFMLSKREGRTLTAEDILSSPELLAAATEINVAYQVAYIRHVIAHHHLEGIRVYGAMHDMHGIYGTKKGALYLTDAPEDSEVDGSAKKTLMGSVGLKSAMEDLKMGF